MNETIDWDGVWQSCERVKQGFDWPSIDFGVILGSGLSAAIEGFDRLHAIPYTDIEALGGSTVPSHESQIFLGQRKNEDGSTARVLFFRGRRHYYEGVGFTPIAFPLALLHALSCPRILLTAAAGALSRGFVGKRCLARINDHNDLFMPKPLLGAPPLGRDRFFPTAGMYDRAFGQIVERSFRDVRGVEPLAGTYAAVPGPNYESGSTAQALAMMKADFVGMSTVPEALIAGALGLDVAGIVSVTNDSGKADNNHEEVGEVSVDNLPMLRLLIHDIAANVASA